MAYTVLVGVNDSAPSRVAVAWAAARASMADGSAELVLVHAMRDVSGLPEPAAGEIRAAGRRLLHDAAQHAAHGHPAERVRTELHEGELIDTMGSAAASADLVVVGTHKTGFIRGRSIGFRSLRIAAEIRAPVAVIPESARRSRSGIVVGVDESAGGTAALDFAAAEAERSGQELTLIRAWSAPRMVGPDTEISISSVERREASTAERILADATDALRRAFPGLPSRSRRIRSRTAEALLDSSASASLLVIGGAGGRPGRSPLGEVGHDVLLNLVCPTVLVHSPVLPEG